MSSMRPGHGRISQEMGFVGGKMVLVMAPRRARRACGRTSNAAEMRAGVGSAEEFFLAL